MKVRNTSSIQEQNQAAFERAFPNGPKQHTSEWWVHKSVATYLKSLYPKVRFYSTLDGFDLGQQRSLLPSIQWFEPGVPDLFVYKRNSQFTMLVIELKKEGAKTKGTDHVARQQAWLDYFNEQGAYAVFAVGLPEAKLVIDKYMKIK
jgi:hypothetical protein